MHYNFNLIYKINFSRYKNTIYAFPYIDKPSAPTGPLVHSDITEDGVTLAWQPPKSDGGSPLTEYIIEKRDTRKSSWSKVGSVKPEMLTYGVSKLIEDTPYLFRVIAVNEEGASEPLQSQDEVIPRRAPGTLFKIVCLYLELVNG